MHVPLKVGEKWTVLCVDGHSYLEDLVNVNSKFHSQKHAPQQSLSNALLKKIKLGGSLLIKDIFISESYIPLQDLPKNMLFLNISPKNFHTKFAFQIQSLNDLDNKENITTKKLKKAEISKPKLPKKLQKKKILVE